MFACREDFCYFTVILKTDTEGHTKQAPPVFMKLLGRLSSHMIAVDLVVLSYICTKMDYMLLMPAASISSLALMSQHTSFNEVKLYELFLRVQSQNNRIKVFRKYFYPALCMEQRTLYFLSIILNYDPLRPYSTFPSPRLCNIFNIALSKHITFSFQRQNFILSV